MSELVFFVEHVGLDDFGEPIRVLIGPFETREQAEQERQLGDNGMSIVIGGYYVGGLATQQL